jgi:hypothetical protein
VVLGKQPGFVVVVGAGGTLTVMNVYTMRLHAQTLHEFQGCFRAQQQGQFVSLADATGSLFVWDNLSDPSPLKTTQTAFQKHLLLAAQEQPSFLFQLEQVLPPIQTLGPLVFYTHASIGLQILVHTQGVEAVVNF